MTITRGDKERFSATISDFSGDLAASTTKIQFTAKHSSADDDSAAVILLTKASGRISVVPPVFPATLATKLEWIVTAADYNIPKLRKALRLEWDLQLVDETETPFGVYTLDSGVMPVQPDLSLTT